MAQPPHRATVCLIAIQATIHLYGILSRFSVFHITKPYSVTPHRQISPLNLGRHARLLSGNTENNDYDSGTSGKDGSTRCVHQ